jgi:hypothetical protein
MDPCLFWVLKRRLMVRNYQHTQRNNAVDTGSQLPRGRRLKTLKYLSSLTISSPERPGHQVLPRHSALQHGNDHVSDLR